MTASIMPVTVKTPPTIAATRLVVKKLNVRSQSETQERSQPFASLTHDGCYVIVPPSCLCSICHTNGRQIKNEFCFRYGIGSIFCQLSARNDSIAQDVGRHEFNVVVVGFVQVLRHVHITIHGFDGPMKVFGKDNALFSFNEASDIIHGLFVSK